MAEENADKLEAHPVQRIISLKDRKLLGYRYQWNDGSYQDLWFEEPNDAEYFYEDILLRCTSNAFNDPAVDV